jgi:hypothetical protein
MGTACTSPWRSPAKTLGPKWRWLWCLGVIAGWVLAIFVIEPAHCQFLKTVPVARLSEQYPSGLRFCGASWMGQVLWVRHSRSGIYQFHILNHWFVIWKLMNSKEEFYHNKYCFLKNVICELVVALQSGRAILSCSQPMALELFPSPISKVCLIKQTPTLGFLVITKKP